MRASDGSTARAPEPQSDGGSDSGSLGNETKEAANAAAAHVRKLAATATTEAQLSALSVATVVFAAVLALALLILGWLFLLSAALWLAVSAGLSVTAGLLIGAAVNLVAALLFVSWCRRLVKNIGFPRTLGLIFPGSR
jgi:hypothetical protein